MNDTVTLVSTLKIIKEVKGLIFSYINKLLATNKNKES